MKKHNANPAPAETVAIKVEVELSREQAAVFYATARVAKASIAEVLLTLACLGSEINYGNEWPELELSGRCWVFAKVREVPPSGWVSDEDLETYSKEYLAAG